MMKSSRSKGRIIGAVVFAGMLAAATYAFTANNTVAASKAGDGATAITGYNVTGVVYNLSLTDPTKISSYEFDLDATARDVRAKVTAAAATYDTCVNTVGNHWTCTPPVLTQPLVAAVDNLRVIATQ